MSDSYQAIYDAVRSRISGGNISDAVDSALREAFGMASHHLQCVAQEYTAAAYEQQRACVLYRPALSFDGNQWCALYGNNLQDGVAGFGDSPAKAMDDFDAQWSKPIPPTKGGQTS
jgi:hypothetical protein